jgi:hypothetical protein
VKKKKEKWRRLNIAVRCIIKFEKKKNMEKVCIRLTR